LVVEEHFLVDEQPVGTRLVPALVPLDPFAVALAPREASLVPVGGRLARRETAPVQGVGSDSFARPSPGRRASFVTPLFLRPVHPSGRVPLRPASAARPAVVV